MTEIIVDTLDGFRAGRGLSLIASSKELDLLRQFFRFCFVRHWTRENPAAEIKSPRNIQPNEIEPYTPEEVGKIVEACDVFGHTDYERLRARAMVLTLRYTALRIGDVAMLARNRVSLDGKRWRVFLRTEKAGKPVFLPIPDELRLALNALQPQRAHRGIAGTTSGMELPRSGRLKALRSGPWQPCLRNLA